MSIFNFNNCNLSCLAKFQNDTTSIQVTGSRGYDYDVAVRYEVNRYGKIYTLEQKPTSLTKSANGIQCWLTTLDRAIQSRIFRMERK